MTEEETDYEDADPASLQRCLKILAPLIQKGNLII